MKLRVTSAQADFTIPLPSAAAAMIPAPALSAEVSAAAFASRAREQAGALRSSATDEFLRHSLRDLLVTEK